MSPFSRGWRGVGLALGLAYVAYASLRVWLDDSDLIDFHQTSLHWWRTGEFTVALGVRHYLPAFVVLISPLVAWPLPITAPLWAALNLVWLIVIVAECGRAARGRGQQGGGQRQAPGAQRGGPSGQRQPPGGHGQAVSGEGRDGVPFRTRWVWPLVLAFPYVHSTIALGQVNLLVLALCVLAMTRFWRPRQDVRAGVLIGLAGVIKLYPLVLALFWLARGRWRGAAAAAGTFVLLAGGLSLAAFGWRGSVQAHRDWLMEVRGEQYRAADETPAGAGPGHLLFWRARNQFHRHNNQSLAAVVRRLTTDLGPPVEKDRPIHVLSLTAQQSRRIYLLAAGTVLAALLGATWAGRAGDEPPRALRPFAAWLAGLIAFVPIYWTHYFVLNLPALVILSLDVWRRRAERRGIGAPEGLFVAWLAAIPLLGIVELRLAGLHCGLALATMAYLLASGARPGEESLPREPGRP